MRSATLSPAFCHRLTNAPKNPALEPSHKTIPSSMAAAESRTRVLKFREAYSASTVDKPIPKTMERDPVVSPHTTAETSPARMNVLSRPPFTTRRRQSRKLNTTTA